MLPRAAYAADSIALQLGWLKSVQYGGSFIAEERGYYADEDLDVTLLPGGPNAPVDPVVISGQALVGVSATDFAARANSNGAGYTILGAKNQRHAFCITSRADNPVRTPADLEGGPRLGLATINQPVLDAIVTLNDLDAPRIEVVTTQGNPAPLASGEVDCFLTLFTTGPIDLELQGIETHSFLLSDYGYDIFSGIYIVTADALENRRDEIVRLLRAEIRGWQDFVDDIDYATRLTVEKYAVDQGLNPEQQKLQAQAQLDLLLTPETAANGLFWMSDEKIQANLETMVLLGIEADEGLFSREILEEVYQGRIRI
jgi:NitT/TauT family transport system substrate-binding protein